MNIMKFIKTTTYTAAMVLLVMLFAEAFLPSTQVIDINGTTNIPADLKLLLPIVAKQNEDDFRNKWIGQPIAFSVLSFQKINQIPQVSPVGWFLIYRAWGGTWNGKEYGEFAGVLIDDAGNRILRIPPVDKKKFRFDTQCKSGFVIQSGTNLLSAVMVHPGSKWESDVVIVISLDQNEKVQFAFSGSSNDPLSTAVHPVDEALRVVWKGKIYFKDFEGDGLMEILVDRRTNAKQSILLYKYDPVANIYKDITTSDKSNLSKYLSQCVADHSIPSVSL